MSGFTHQPGKAVQTQSAVSNHNAPEPGKATLAQTHAPGVNAPGVATGALTELQQARLGDVLVGRIESAHLAYMTALTDLRLNETIKKEDEFPVIGTLLLLAGGKVAEKLLAGACAMLRKSGEAVKELAEAGVHGADVTKVEAELFGLSAKSLDTIIKAGVDQGKDKAKSGMKAGIGAAAADNKAAALSFVDYLRDASMTMFQGIREAGINATTGVILGLIKSFEGSLHTPSHYRVELGGMLERYMASNARKVGHSTPLTPPPVRNIRREMKVAWLHSGSDIRLGYIQSDFEDEIERHPGAAYTTTEHAISYEDEGPWKPGLGGPEVRGHRDAESATFAGFVEPEFVEVARQTHDARWAASPEHYTLNYPSMTLTKRTP